MASAVQTAVAVNPAVGRPGLEYDSSFSDIVSWIATVAIPFGALVYESAEGKATLPTATGNVTGGKTGVALIDHTKASGVGYEIGDAVRVMRRGRCFVLNEEALAFGDTLFARFAAGGGGSQLGAFRNDADTASASTPTNMTLLKAGGINLAAVQVGDVS
jgi:hypothetical protein